MCECGFTLHLHIKSTKATSSPSPVTRKSQTRLVIVAPAHVWFIQRPVDTRFLTPLQTPRHVPRLAAGGQRSDAERALHQSALSETVGHFCHIAAQKQQIFPLATSGCHAARCTQVRTQKDSSHTHKCVYHPCEDNGGWNSLRPLLTEETGQKHECV